MRGYYDWWKRGYYASVGVIIGCAIGGSPEKWQIHTQWSHFLRLAVTVDFDDILLAPKASEASKGAFYLFLGVVSGYCDA